MEKVNISIDCDVEVYREGDRVFCAVENAIPNKLTLWAAESAIDEKYPEETFEYFGTNAGYHVFDKE